MHVDAKGGKWALLLLEQKRHQSHAGVVSAVSAGSANELAPVRPRIQSEAALGDNTGTGVQKRREESDARSSSASQIAGSRLQDENKTQHLTTEEQLALATVVVTRTAAAVA